MLLRPCRSGVTTETLQQLKIKLLEGEKTGSVSDQVPTVPLMRDLEDQLKKVKLHRDWKKDGLIEKHFDLRKSSASGGQPALAPDSPAGY